MTGSLSVFIIGGYGTFGGRLADLLAPDRRLTIYIAGRSLDRAQHFAERMGGSARKIPIVFDRSGDLGALARQKPDIVIDASGPFQAFTTDRYRVVEACLRLGIDYIDLADGLDFVDGIEQFDTAARERKVFALSGASTFPVLTAAVVGELAGGLVSLASVAAGIAPSPYAGVGPNVIRAIASYAGKPIVAPAGSAARYALIDIRLVTIAPPGHLPLRNTLFSLVEVPDLRVLPRIWPELRSIWIGAGPTPEILHRALIGLAWLVRWRLLPSLLPFAGIFHAVINRLRWGEHRGGMFVQVSGADADGPVTRNWHLIAEGDAGPLIPSMAAAAIVTRCLEGRRPESGARSAARDLNLADYASAFAGRAIVTGRRDERPGDALRPLYRRLLGTAYDRLPLSIRRLHDLDRAMTVNGRASVERGRSVLARLAGALIGFPPAGPDVPVTVAFEARDGREIWRRSFAGGSFMSIQEEGAGRSSRLLVERFGPLAFAIALVVDDTKLRLVLRRWSAFGVPLPLWLAPRSEAFETEESGRFRFHVEIGHPLTGLIVRYRGWLA